MYRSLWNSTCNICLLEKYLVKHCTYMERQTNSTKHNLFVGGKKASRICETVKTVKSDKLQVDNAHQGPNLSKRSDFILNACAGNKWEQCTHKNFQSLNRTHACFCLHMPQRM